MTNPDGAAPDEVVDEVHAAVAQFAAWSGRDGVCVTEIVLEPEVTEPDGEAFGGMYHASGKIEVDYTGSVTTTVYHCSRRTTSSLSPTTCS